MPTKKGKAPKHRGTNMRDAIIHPKPPEAFGLTEREVFEAWITDEGRRIYETARAHRPPKKVWSAFVFPRPPWWDAGRHGQHLHLRYCSTCRAGRPCHTA